MEDVNNVEFTNPEENEKELTKESVALSLDLPANSSWSRIKAKIDELEKKDLTNVPASVDAASDQEMYSK